MFRWYQAASKPASEVSRLRRLAENKPPVAIPTPMQEVQLEHAPPFDYCVVLQPVVGVPLHEYLSLETSRSAHRAVGVALARLVLWLGSLEKELEVSSVSAQAADLVKSQERCLNRMQRAGLTEQDAQGLFHQLTALWEDRAGFVPCHGDLYPQHVLVDKHGTLGVIDWDDVGLDHPVKDFTYWYEPVGRDVGQREFPVVWQALRERYRHGFPTAEEERRLKLYALAGELAYDDDESGQRVRDWLRYYGGDF